MRFRTLAIAAAMLAATGPAFAGCYQGLGCTDSDYFDKSDLRDLNCKSLWVVRNAMFDEHGYCFQTQRAISYFGNGGCWVNDAEDINFNKYERQNIETIKSVERQYGC